MILGSLLLHSSNSAIKITERKIVLSVTLQAEEKLKLNLQQDGKANQAKRALGLKRGTSPAVHIGRNAKVSTALDVRLLKPSTCFLPHHCHVTTLLIP